LRYHLAPLSETETKEYIEKRLKIAGSDGSIFTPEAIKEFLRSTGLDIDLLDERDESLDALEQEVRKTRRPRIPPSNC
jgi:ethanolamine utilization cobalamin adenosyltransferase